MSERGDLARFHDLATKSASKKTIVGMFSTACTACADGSLVDLLNTSAAQDRKNSFLIILPGSFTTSDVKNFKTNLELSIPVEVADVNFTREWLMLNEKYGEKAINGSVFVVDKKHVLSVVNGVSETKRLLKDLK